MAFITKISLARQSKLKAGEVANLYGSINLGENLSITGNTYLKGVIQNLSSQSLLAIDSDYKVTTYPLTNLLTPNLQAVTTTGNKTTNGIQLLGSSNIDLSQVGSYLTNQGFFGNDNGVINNNLTYNNTSTLLGFQTSILTLLAESTNAGAQFNTRVSGSNAINNNDFVTLSQLNTSIGNYYTKAQSDARFVSITGNTTIGGNKIFTSPVIGVPATNSNQFVTLGQVPAQLNLSGGTNVTVTGSYPNLIVNSASSSGATVPDATTMSKGIIKLAGELSGTADFPTVPGKANIVGGNYFTAGAQLSEDGFQVMGKKGTPTADQLLLNIERAIILGKTQGAMAFYSINSDGSQTGTGNRSTTLTADYRANIDPDVILPRRSGQLALLTDIPAQVVLSGGTNVSITGLYPNLTINASTSGGSGVTNVSYTQLITLINNSQLSVGTSYLITDFHSTFNKYTVTKTVMSGYTQYGFTNSTDVYSGDLEPLIVRANSVNTLYPEAKSTLYPDHFIKYTVTNLAQPVLASDKGTILQRIDPLKKIDCNFDFRALKYINIYNNFNYAIKIEDSGNIKIISEGTYGQLTPVGIEGGFNDSYIIGYSAIFATGFYDCEINIDELIAPDTFFNNVNILQSTSSSIDQFSQYNLANLDILTNNSQQNLNSDHLMSLSSNSLNPLSKQVIVGLLNNNPTYYKYIPNNTGSYDISLL